jgi:acylphosphatase
VSGAAVARRIVVHGLVQGVFFRDSCRREAEHLGVTGWVRNAGDGSVEAHFEGPEDAVAALVDWAHDGPRRARVDRVEVHDATSEHTGEFRVRD